MITTYGKPTLPISCMQDFHSRTETDSFMRYNDSIKNQYVFAPMSWVGVVPETNLYTSDRYLVPLSFNFSCYEDHSLDLTLWIGNFPDQDERKRFVEAIKTADTGGKLNMRKASDKTTTLYVKNISLKHDNGDTYDLQDYNAVVDKLVEVYNSPEARSVISLVDEVVKQFNFAPKRP